MENLLFSRQHPSPAKTTVSADMCLTYSPMQITTEQAESWADNPNTFVADEEDCMTSVRVIGELLLDELVCVSSTTYNIVLYLYFCLCPCPCPLLYLRIHIRISHRSATGQPQVSQSSMLNPQGTSRAAQERSPLRLEGGNCQAGGG